MAYIIRLQKSKSGKQVICDKFIMAAQNLKNNRYLEQIALSWAPKWQFYH